PHQFHRGARGTRGDIQRGDSVITGEQHHARPFDRPYRHRGLRRRQPLAQLVEPAQRPGRHDHALPPGLRVAAYPAVRTLDQIGEVVEIKRAHSPNSTGPDGTPRGPGEAPAHTLPTPPRHPGAVPPPKALPSVTFCHVLPDIQPSVLPVLPVLPASS